MNRPKRPIHFSTYSNRKVQMLHVYDTIDMLEDKELSYFDLMVFIQKKSRVMEGVSPGRYTAMVKSVIRGATTDDDVRGWGDFIVR